MNHDQAFPALRTKAIESLLIEKGQITERSVDQIASAYEHDIGPLRGARVVAQAWTDANFKSRLLEDASAAIKELGLGGVIPETVVALENTEEVHNIVTCTLCSCYPWSVLGLPPSWYKEPAYRSRVVREPRGVLAEFGVELGPEVEVRVWDSSSEIRYMVIPRRPQGTEELSIDQLAGLVTRDSMIGTGLVTA
jgi:nitrile hydratase